MLLKEVLPVSKFYRYSFYPGSSKTELFQGKSSELNEYLKKTGMAVVKGGTGSYVLMKVPYGEILELENEYSEKPLRKIRPTKTFLSNRYQKKNIKESDYARLAVELNLGEISFDDLYEKFAV